MVASRIALGLAAAAGAFALPGEFHKRQTAITSSQTGTANGYYYSFWTNGDGTVSYENTGTGAYSVTWNNQNTNGGDFTCGVGWNPGSAQAITYNADFSPSGNAYLAVYGWTENPLVEYYILENYGDYNPGSAMTSVGTVTSDGSSYTIYNHTQTNQPSIEGTSTFQQYWSIRSSLRSSGTVTTSNHFNAWKELGLDLGSFNYQIMLTEGYESSGTSSVTIGGGSSNTGGTTTTSRTTTTTGTPTSTGVVQHYGQCGGNTWTGPTACASPYTCQVLNTGYYQCLSPTGTTVGSQSTATGVVQHYGQCGGNTWTGPTACASPYTCQVLNTGYYQCLSPTSTA